MGMSQAVKTVYSKYASFSGRASRSEFWWFYLFYVVVVLVLNFVDSILGWQYGSSSFDVTMNDTVNHYTVGGVGILATIFGLLTLLPMLGVMARRLHDSGHSGLWIIWGYLLSIACCIGFVILIVFWCQKSEPGDTKYGPQPAA